MKVSRDPLENEYNFIIQKVMDYRIAKIILVGNYFDLFTLIAKGCDSVGKICSKLGTDERATEILLDALSAIQLLKKRKGIYVNSKTSKRYLIKGTSDYKGDNLKYQELVWDCWTDLKDVVKRGVPAKTLDKLLSRQNADFIKNYIYGMDNIAKPMARAVAEKLDWSRIRKMLDVGGGSGAYATHFAQKNPQLEAVILDLPETLKITREIIAQNKMKERIRLLPGNYLTADFGRGYDLILFSHITHNEGEGVIQKLCKKAYAALNPGGILAVHDFTVNEDKASPLFSALFSVNVMVYTKAGKTYSWREYKQWMGSAGFKGLRKFDILPDFDNRSVLISGRKAVGKRLRSLS
jgi:ubiquinone/menaquinone biosynthesis C-methylase UbiE